MILSYRRLFVAVLSGLLSMSLSATEAQKATTAVAGTALRLSEILEHFSENPLAYGQAVKRYCAVDSNAERDICAVADDIAAWSGEYDNHRVDVVPPAALPTEGNGYAPVAAMSILPQLTSDRTVVIINEVHGNPETRVLPFRLLAPLRKQGFDTLAMETISDDGTALQARGYPVFNSGYYSREPNMGRVIREALRLGYRVVGYDHMGPGSNDVAKREQAQADQLAQIVRADGGHRVLIVAGMAHSYKKAGAYLNGVVPMAQRLAKILKTEPLSIDQIYTFDSAWGSSPMPDNLYVFMRNKEAWASQPGQFDVSIVGKINRTLPARQAWAALAPELHLVSLDARPCAGRGCIIAAYRPGEGTVAVPLDQVPIPSGSGSAQLLLPAGNMVLRYRDLTGKVIASYPR